MADVLTPEGRAKALLQVLASRTDGPELPAIAAHLAQAHADWRAEWADLAEAYKGRWMAAEEAISSLRAALAQAHAEGRADAFEEAAMEAEAGGCDCHFAPCDHDEIGRRLAFLIRRLAAGVAGQPSGDAK